MNRRVVAGLALVALALLIAGAVVFRAGNTRPDPLLRAEVGMALGGGINDLTDEEMLDQLDDVATLGVEWIRVDFAWSAIEPEPGEWFWDRTDLIVAGAEERGMQVLGLLTYTPRWARPEGTSDKAPPIDNDAFARFVAEVAERHRGAVRHWEIWNEPNHPPFWEGGADPEAYAALFGPAATAIRAAQPNAFIVTGGLSPNTDGDGALSPETYIEAMLPLIDADLVDAVGVHPYSWPAAPDNDTRGWNTFGRLPDMKAQVDEIMPGVRLWFTEYGAPTDEVSYDEQASLIARAVDCASGWEWAGPLFVYTWTDWPGESFGVVEQSGVEKPAHAVLADAIGGSTRADDCGLD